MKEPVKIKPSFEPFLKQTMEDAKSSFEAIKEKEVVLAEEKPAEIVYEQQTFLTEESRPQFKIIGQVFDTYWIIEFQEIIQMILLVNL